MKKKSLALLLLLALLCGLAGCGENPLGDIIVMDTPPAGTLREYLGISPGDLTGLDEMLETADGSGTAKGNKLDIVDSQGQGGTTVRILETFGDGCRLFVLYGLTLPDSLGENPSDKEVADLFALNAEIGPIAWKELQNTIFWYDKEGRCMYYRLAVTFYAPGYTDQDLTLQLYQKRLYDTEDFVNCSVTWTPHNKAPQLTAEDKGGVCTISPLCLSVDLPINAGAIQGLDHPDNAMAYMQESLKLVYRDSSILDNFDGGWEADPVRVIDAKPPGGIFRLDALDHVEFLGYKFSFNGQEGGSP